MANDYTAEQDNAIARGLCEGASYETIAASVGHSVASVKSHAHKLRKRGFLPPAHRPLTVRESTESDCPLLSDMAQANQSHAYIDAMREHHPEFEVRLRTVKAWRAAS